MAEEIRLHIMAIMNKVFSLIKLLQNKNLEKLFPYVFFISLHVLKNGCGKERV